MGEDPASRPTSMVHRVAVLALPGVVAFDLTIATHTFGHEGHDRYALTLCTPVPGLVATTSGFAVAVSEDLDALDQADTVVPGFDRSPVAPHVLGALRQVHDRGGRVASICTGAFALARAGLLDGRRATTHWAHAAQLAREHPQVSVDPTALYVDEGPVLTSAGLSAGIDLCLHLISRDFGEAAAIDRARAMVAPLHRAGGQAQFVPPAPTETGEPTTAILAATTWARDRLAEPITVADLARQAVQAPRTFARNFTGCIGISPLQWITQQRLQLACRLLENPTITIDTVANRSGLGTAGNLRLHFHRAYTTTPTAYRAAFNPPRPG